MKKKRLFISINIPIKIKNHLISSWDSFLNIPAHWITKENLHLTLIFLGYFPETKIDQIEKIIIESIKNIKPFKLSFDCISFGPLKEKRLIWAKLQSSDELSLLVNNLQKSVLKMKIENIKRKKEKFLPHITLARIKTWEMKLMSPEEIPNVNKKLSLEFNVKNIALMESEFKKSGVEYKTIKLFKL